MKNPKVYGFEITFEKTEGEINNGQSRDTGNIGHIRHRTKTKHNHYCCIYELKHICSLHLSPETYQ
jgi:hypothetical protein